MGARTWIAIGLLNGCLLFGCDGTEGSGGDDDTSVSTDDDDTTEPLGDDDICGGEDWPDLTAEPHEGCAPDAPPETWQMAVSWAWGEEHACSTVQAGHFVDVDGDGQVTETEPMQLWFNSNGPGGGDSHEVLIDLDGNLYSDILSGTWRSGATVGEVDGTRPGMEYLVSYYFNDGSHEDWIAAHSATGTVWETSLDEGMAGRPWLTDLDGDGGPEILLTDTILDGATGAIVGQIDGVSDMVLPVAADLDLDGEREILSATSYNPQEINIHNADGTLRATCWTGHWSWTDVVFAVANLDADPELEFLAATTGYLVACDTDGKLLSETFTEIGQPSLIGVGQLDADVHPEVVVSDCYGVYGFDHDFTQIWRYDSTEHPYDWQWFPFALADLDGNGQHEVIARMFGTLVVLDGRGEELAVVKGNSHCSSNFGAPAVVDVDADGLAEIVVPAWPDIAIVENQLGGWLVDGADEPWPGVNKYPGDRRPDGSIPLPSEEPWRDPATNVWQGLPAADPEPAYSSDLTGEIADVCEAGDEAGVAVYVKNHGHLETDLDCGVALYSLADGSILGSGIMPAGLPSGVGRAMEIAVPTSAIAGGLELIIDEADAIPECDESNNTAIWPSS